VDLTFNSVEGPEDGVAVATGVTDPDTVLARIRQHPAVESAERLLAFRIPELIEPREVEGNVEPLGSFPNDPDFPKQWNLRLIHAPEAWKKSRGKGVIVAIIDTGIAYEDHGDFAQVPDLIGAKFAPGYDFVNDDEHANDDHGHGTHVAGTVAQVTNNGVGVAGVAFEATLMPLKVLNHFGSGNAADIADAIRFAADHGAKVLNLSLGGGLRSSVMSNAVAYARKKGAVVVCAAGNTGTGQVQYPAAYPDSFAVASVGPDGKKAPYSSWGKELDLSAPGGNKQLGEEKGILQNTIDPRDIRRSVYAYYQGTSMAAPHVAGVAALLFGAGARSPDEVEEALIKGASPVEQGRTDEYGAGLLNAEGALRALGAEGQPNWTPFLWAAGLLAAALLTMTGRARPGYLNVFFTPGFLLAMLLCTVGAFFLRWPIIVPVPDSLSALSTPIPDWQRWIFGRGRLANPLFYSALIPALAALVAVPVKSIRRIVAGVAIGFAGFLAYTAWVKAPALAWLPFTFLARPWLILNLLVCMLMARALLKREAQA
jgi:serine protease